VSFRRCRDKIFRRLIALLSGFVRAIFLETCMCSIPIFRPVGVRTRKSGVSLSMNSPPGKSLHK
jgi:hypothetical protein